MSLTELTGNPRHDQLLMLIAERGYMNIDELANLLDVSTQTVRRDIRKLSEQGLITRHHGGAGRASSVVNTAFEQREVSQTEEKKRLPKRWQTIFLMDRQYLSPSVRLLNMLPGRYLTTTFCRITPTACVWRIFFTTTRALK